MRVRGFVALLCVSSATFGVAACGLTADFSGLQTGAPSPLDAGSEDGGTYPSDARADVPVATSDAGPGFCASLKTPVKLCSDFDEGEPVDAGWESTDTYGGESVAVGATAFSPPGAFASAINPSGAPSSARLLQTVPLQSASVHLEFEMLPGPR